MKMKEMGPRDRGEDGGGGGGGVMVVGARL